MWRHRPFQTTIDRDGGVDLGAYQAVTSREHFMSKGLLFILIGSLFPLFSTSSQTSKLNKGSGTITTHDTNWLIDLKASYSIAEQ
jgi:hypothetical protein